ncbi:MAG: ATP-binding protein, partial [Syntrophales bacterium]|nr:ATP-binding protein [Syntrophales bacterium]
METFTLAVVSLAIAVSVFFLKRKEPLARAFAFLCLLIFFHKFCQFSYELLRNPLLETCSRVFLLGVAPMTLQCTRLLVNDVVRISTRRIAMTVLISVVWGGLLFLPLPRWWATDLMMELYVAFAVIISYTVIIANIRRKTPGGERTRLIYIAVAMGITATLSAIAALSALGWDIPPLSNIFVAVMLYMIFAIISRPHLVELKELLARALVTAVLTLMATTLIYVVFRLFARTASSPFTYILLASFLVIVAIEPVKQVLKAILSTLFPESKDVFNFMYTLDQKLEQEKSLLLAEMAPVLAHEIRNPLGSIKGAAQYLRSEATREEEQRLLDVIIEEVNRLNSVVTQFLYYARPFNLNLKRQDINAVVEKAVAIISTSALAERVQIERELRPDLPPVEVDGEQLIRVILNIAFNALEAMPEGGKLSIKTRRITSDVGEAVGIAIRDTGPGIAPEDRARLFQPFERLGASSEVEGTGLGLALSMR